MSISDLVLASMDPSDFSLAGIWAKMGAFASFIVYLLAFMSFISITIAVERAVVFFRLRRDSQRLITAIGEVLERRDFAGALEKAKRPDGKVGYLGRVLKSGLQAFHTMRHEHEDVAYESVTRALERQSQREVHTLKRGLTTLASVSSLAPFVGLMGTTVGIVNSFTEMAASGSGGLAVVSAGVAEALITTAFGLLVAIPALAFYNYLQGWVDARAVDMADTANELLDVVASELKAEAMRQARSAQKG
jgi:biopolymer transport protein ExbB/biopolymer transport protein TolQ